MDETLKLIIELVAAIGAVLTLVTTLWVKITSEQQRKAEGEAAREAIKVVGAHVERVADKVNEVHATTLGDAKLSEGIAIGAAAAGLQQGRDEAK